MKHTFFWGTLLISLWATGCVEETHHNTCVPDCSQKVCGPDGCGGSCGSCTETGTQCSNGICKQISCIPSCRGRECGSNGCGGICGTCASGILCNESTGLCEQCKPNCTNKSCGDDGCGGQCGQCSNSEICQNNQCIDPLNCIPDCNQKSCGSNGCGGSCGSCPPSYVCEQNQCVERKDCTPNCTNRSCGSDGCDGQCGVCLGELVCDDTSGSCVSCLPNCIDRTCGPDGCGGECGQCNTNTSCNESTGQCMPYRVKGRILIETQSVYYDAYTLPTFDKKIDIAGKKLPLSLRDADGKELATTTVSNNGTFEMAISRLPLATDWISIVPIWYVANHLKVAVLKANPDSTPYNVWEWTIKLSNYTKTDDPGDLGDIKITTEQYSGGLYLFQLVVEAFENLVKYGYTVDLGSLPSMAVVWAPDVTWNCGTCFLDYETEVGKSTADTQMLVGGSQNDESAWGMPTILHEFGHYILSQQKDTSDGGTHYMSSTTEPSLAWSEGWATFYSLMMMSFRKNTPITQYWRLTTDEYGNNTGYWLDYAHLFDNSQMGSLWIPEPTIDHEKGMKQPVSEAWISYMLWDFFDGLDISDVSLNPDKVALGAKKIFNAISSPRYNQYYNESRCTAGTDFVDFVDAVLCQLIADNNDAVANDIMDLIVLRNFPYDRSPVCQ